GRGGEPLQRGWLLGPDQRYPKPEPRCRRPDVDERSLDEADLDGVAGEQRLATGEERLDPRCLGPRRRTLPLPGIDIGPCDPEGASVDDVDPVRRAHPAVE